MKYLLSIVCFLLLSSLAFAQNCPGGVCKVPQQRAAHNCCPNCRCGAPPARIVQVPSRWPHRPSLPYAVGATGRWFLGFRQRGLGYGQ